METNIVLKKSRICILIECILVIVLLSGCKSDLPKEQNTKRIVTELKGTIKITGSEALYPLMKIWAEEFTKDKPDLKILVLDVGTENGLADLLSGNTDLAMVSRSLTPVEEAKGLWRFTVSKEGVIPIINENNPFLKEILNKGIQRETLIDLFTSGNVNTWGKILGIDNNDPVKVFIRSDFSGTAEVWSEYLGIKQNELMGIPLTGYAQIVEAVSQEPLSLSFCNAHNAYDLKVNKVRKGLSTLPIDFNNSGKIESVERFYENLCMLQRAAYIGKLPSHLCRELYLVSIDKPQKPETISFLRWIYTDGQKLAVKEGYAALSNCKTREIIKLLDELENNWDSSIE